VGRRDTSAWALRRWSVGLAGRAGEARVTQLSGEMERAGRGVGVQVLLGVSVGRAKRERERARLTGAGPRKRVLDWAGLAGLSAGVVWAGFGLS